MTVSSQNSRRLCLMSPPQAQQSRSSSSSPRTTSRRCSTLASRPKTHQHLSSMTQSTMPSSSTSTPRPPSFQALLQTLRCNGFPIPYRRWPSDCWRDTASCAAHMPAMPGREARVLLPARSRCLKQKSTAALGYAHLSIRPGLHA